MGAPAAQFQFAAEIVAFLVCLAGTALLLLRARLFSRRTGPVVLLVLGFGSWGAAAFLHGAIQAGTTGPAPVVGLRLAGGLVLLSGALPPRSWAAGRGARLLLAGAGLLVVASAATAWTGRFYPAESLLIAGAVLAGTALAGASGRAIGARLTAAAAGTLLIVVVTLSVALSTVLSGTVRDDALRRLQTRSSSLSTTISDSWSADLADAKLVAASIEAAGLAAPNPGPELQATITRLTTQFFSDVSLMWVAPDGTVLAASPQLSAHVGPEVGPAIAASSLVSRSAATNQPGGTAGVAAGRAVDVAAYPALPPGSTTVTGVAVVLSPLDSSYLAAQVRDDPSLRAVLVAGGRVLSAYPRSALSQPADALRAAGSALTGHSPAPLTAGDRFVVAQPVYGGNGRPVMAVLVETPTSVVDDTRQRLFRTLFLIAFGGSIIAFVLSVAVADRVSRALGVLTGAARRIRSGETDVRTGVSAEDEIGVLAEAFDAMAESVEEHAAALRRAADEEAQLRGRLQSVIAGMGEALVSVDRDGTVSEWNRAAERLTGVRRGRAVGRPVRSVLTARFEDGVAVADVLAGKVSPPRAGGRATLEVGDVSVPVAVSFGVVAAESAAAGTVAVLRDLRPEMEVERMKSEFLSRVGHELRTPLTGILGYSQLLAGRDVPPERARTFHDEIVAQSRRLLRTVQMLEFFATTAANRLGLDLTPLSVRAVVDDALERIRSRPGATHRLVAQVPRDLPDIEADRRWVDLALDELLDNAAKFSPDGGRVVVSAEAVDGGAVRLTVTDEGPGMSERERELAFGEFVQGDSSDTRQYGGLGLGLPLVQRVAEAHGGSVELASERGRGTRVSVILPGGESLGAGRRRPVA